MQNFSNSVQEEHFLKIEVEQKEIEKICVYQWKNNHVSETVRDRAKATINH